MVKLLKFKATFRVLLLSIDCGGGQYIVWSCQLGVNIAVNFYRAHKISLIVYLNITAKFEQTNQLQQTKLTKLTS